MRLTGALECAAAVWITLAPTAEAAEVMKPETTGRFEFVCRQIPEVRFAFPIFKHWEPKAVVADKEGRCTVQLDWPENIEYEVPRAIHVRRLPRDDAAVRRVVPEKTRPNPQGIAFGRAFDPGLYVKGYKPPAGHYDYLQFTAGDSLYRIQLDADSEEHGFSKTAFEREVFESFALRPAGSPELEAARVGAASLARPEQFLPGYRGFLDTVVKSLGEPKVAAEFFASVEQDKASGHLVFHLWHETAFLPKHRNMVGNPGGKCRDAWVDPTSGKVEKILFWQ